jgi:phenylalanyl-tRNA synthetase alpha chain
MNNIPLSITNKIGKNLYQIPNHPICIIKNKIYDYFRSSREIIEDISPYVDVQSNFDDLLIPKDHPSRSKSDTFYSDDNTVLRTHTSAHQTKFMRDGKKNFLVTGDVYRKDEIDAFHYPVFHQMEGVSILNNEIDPVEVCDVIKRDLGGLIEFLFPNCEYKFVDTYFPFTEPSCEIEVLLNGKWVEVLGAGVIRKQIMESCGLGHVSGWAFGLGLERLAMIFFEVPDIRYFWTDDERFKNQFQSGQITKFKEYSKYLYQKKKESLTPQKKAAIRKKSYEARRAKKADPSQFGKMEYAALKHRVAAKARQGRKMGFNLTPEYIQSVFENCGGVCALSKIPFDMNLGTAKNRNPYRPSVDRISSSKGYVKGNIQIVLGKII